MFLLGQLRDEISVPLRFLWPAIYTTPTLAIQPMKLLQTSVADPDDAPDAAMGISSEGRPTPLPLTVNEVSLIVYSQDERLA